MGPDQQTHFSQIKRDAAAATLRHFRDEIEANSDGEDPEVTAAKLAKLEDTRKAVADIGDSWSETIETPAQAPTATPARLSTQDEESDKGARKAKEN